jgi:hypothetical protein
MIPRIGTSAFNEQREYHYCWGMLASQEGPSSMELVATQLSTYKLQK